MAIIEAAMSVAAVELLMLAARSDPVRRTRWRPGLVLAAPGPRSAVG